MTGGRYWAESPRTGIFGERLGGRDSHASLGNYLIEKSYLVQEHLRLRQIAMFSNSEDQSMPFSYASDQSEPPGLLSHHDRIDPWMRSTALPSVSGGRSKPCVEM